MVENATDKRLRKGCDWILANNVGDDNVILVHGPESCSFYYGMSTQEEWKLMKKDEIARDLATANH